MSAFEVAFLGDPALLSRISTAAKDDSKVSLLLHDISEYVIRLRRSLAPNGAPTGNEEKHDQHELATKKRKLGQDPGNHAIPNTNGSGDTASWLGSSTTFTATDISVAVPLRKKLRLEVLDHKHDSNGWISFVTPEGEKALAMAWNAIDQVISVPVPEKAQPAHNFVVLPVTGPSGASFSKEAIVFTVPATPAKNVSFPDASDHVRDGENQDEVIRRVFNKQLAKTRKAVVVPHEQDFVSGVVQAHRKGEKGWHVKAWRGSKDGFLYFLSTGILFGFRKPLLFFPFHNVTSISYSSVLQRTFNLNITHRPGNCVDDEEEELEFAMLDQADFAGIDAYVKRHGLHDASLAEARRAKMYNVNRVKQENTDAIPHAQSDGSPTDCEDGEDDNLTRREKALQDAEDAEEEDYDPSGGSSEGSGEDSDEEEDHHRDIEGREMGLDEEVEEEVGGYEDEVEGDY